MAMVSSRMQFSGWLVLMISIISTISNGRARARFPVSDRVTGFYKPKGVVKTIESYEDGEVIDCVDIFKQPAFDHPLLKNHTIQMKSGLNLKANGAEYVKHAVSQAWWKYGECPEGAIPIRRPQEHNNSHVIPLTSNVKLLNLSRDGFTAPPGREFAQVSLTDGNYLGASATVNVWNPTVIYPEVSFSEIWLISGPEESMNVMEAGWMVETVSSPTKQAKSFIYWTSDGYKHTGCYNLNCPGFVQTSREIALGALILPVSTYGGQQYDISVDIVKNQALGRWWLRIADIDIGYWPAEIFTSLSGAADAISWGGQIVNTEPGGRHTPTQMGSGHFPTEGYGKTSYFRHLKFVDAGSIERDPENLEKYVTRPECYDLLLGGEPSSTSGVNFYYGGPGFSAQCAKY